MAKRKEVLHIEGEPCLKCSKCKKIKPIELFQIRNEVKYKNGDPVYRSHCVPCGWKASRANWIKRRDNGEHRRVSYRYTIRVNYNLSVDQFNDMYSEQEGKCKICGTRVENIFMRKDGVRVAVDHCHSTGRIRGLLCGKCNCGIGKLNDDPDILRVAIKYLEE